MVNGPRGGRGKFLNDATWERTGEVGLRVGPEALPPPSLTLQAVSYTHLDVYKRQNQNAPNCNLSYNNNQNNNQNNMNHNQNNYQGDT